MSSFFSALTTLGMVGLAAADLPNPNPTSALFVVGTPPGEPLWADALYKERLERQGYQVNVVEDKSVTEQDCEGSDIMLISASISGGAVGTKLNNCTTPQMIWESRLYSLNGMTADVDEAQRVTSAFFHKYHETSFDSPEKVPPLPTGAMVRITKDGADSPLSGPPVDAGKVPFWTVKDYGMNYISESQLGEGAKVIAILPPTKTGDFPVDPNEKKATFFYYEKGGALYNGTGASPAFRIGWPVFGFSYGPSPSCEELVGVDCVDNVCQDNCQTKKQIIDSGANPMPLSCYGVNMLDHAISMLTKEARKRKPSQQKPSQQKPSQQKPSQQADA